MVTTRLTGGSEIWKTYSHMFVHSAFMEGEAELTHERVTASVANKL